MKKKKAKASAAHHAPPSHRGRRSESSLSKNQAEESPRERPNETSEDIDRENPDTDKK